MTVHNTYSYSAPTLMGITFMNRNFGLRLQHSGKLKLENVPLAVTLKFIKTK